MKNRYTVTVIFRDGSTRQRTFDDCGKADNYHRHYMNMNPDRNKPKTQVEIVRTVDERSRHNSAKLVGWIPVPISMIDWAHDYKEKRQ
jgi:hypothetical protein